MKTTEELIKVALLPKPVTVEIKGIAQKCCDLMNKAFKGDETVCIYNHFTNTFDELTDDTIIQSHYPVLVFKLKQPQGTKVRELRSHAFFTPSNMPFSIEGETDANFWKYTFDMRYGLPIEPIYTVVEENNFNYMDFKQDPLYTEAMANYMVDNAYIHHLLSFTDFHPSKYFISKNLFEFKAYDPHVLKNCAHKLGYMVNPENRFTSGCNLTRLKGLVNYPVKESFGITAINLGVIENKINRVEDDIALLGSDHPFDNTQRLFTLGDLVKIQVSYIMHKKAHEIGLLNYSSNVNTGLTLQWLSYVYIYESFMLGCKPVKNLKTSTIYAMIQLREMYYGNEVDLNIPSLENYTLKVSKDGKAPQWRTIEGKSAENLDINLMKFLECLDDSIAVAKPKNPYIDEYYCEMIYQKAMKKIQMVDDLVALFFL